jgi:hypothetical protein
LNQIKAVLGIPPDSVWWENALEGASTGPLGFALLTLQGELKSLNETLRQQQFAEEEDRTSWIHALTGQNGLIRTLLRRRHFQGGSDR